MRTRLDRALGAFGLVAALLLAGPSEAANPAAQVPADKQEREKSLEHEVIEWKAPPPPPIGPGNWSFRWRDGIFLERYDGKARLHFGGRVLVDAGTYHLDEGLRDAAGEAGWESDADIRQGQVFAQGTFLERFYAKAVYDWEEGDFQDVFFGVRGLGPLGTLQLGYMDVPFSLEDRASRLAIPFMEKSLPNAFAPGNDSGVLLTNTLLDDRLRWAAGVFVNTDGFGGNGGNDTAEGRDGSWTVNLRVTGLPVRAEEGKRLAVLGFSYGHRFGIRDDLSLSVRPESRIAPALLDTGSISGAEGADVAGVEMAWVDGAFSAQGELLGSFLKRSGAGNLFFWGGYLEATWSLTGEGRVYGARSATFGRLVPKRNFAPWEGSWGAFQVAARVSWIDLDDRDISGGRQLDVTLGLNWVLHTNARLAFNYVHGHVRGSGNADIAQIRIQLDH
jgi:phosphate-selective porin OprO/OprP